MLNSDTDGSTNTLDNALGVERRFSTDILPWSNGTCEIMMRQVSRTTDTVLHEHSINAHDSVEFVQTVHQWTLNTTLRER